MKLKLGLKPIVERPKLKFAKYANYSTLPSIAGPVYWSRALTDSWGMMANDTVGDCFWAAAGHAFMTWSANAQATMDQFTDTDILCAYSSCTGYNPADPNSDQGTEMIAGLNWLKNRGIMTVKGAHKFGPYVEVDPKNHDELRVAHYLFGGLMLCIQVPENYETQPIWGPSSSRILGGHAIWAPDFDDTGITVVTWGDTRLYTLDGSDQNTAAAVAVLPPEWIADNNLAPSGFDLGQLLADEAAL